MFYGDDLSQMPAETKDDFFNEDFYRDEVYDDPFENLEEEHNDEFDNGFLTPFEEEYDEW